MFKQVIKREEFFYDIPAGISTTGVMPRRGLYTRITLNDNGDIWFDSKGNIIIDKVWIQKLNELHSKYL